MLMEKWHEAPLFQLKEQTVLNNQNYTVERSVISSIMRSVDGGMTLLSLFKSKGVSWLISVKGLNCIQ